MIHRITTILWDKGICGECGFPISQHEILYGTDEEKS